MTNWTQAGALAAVKSASGACEVVVIDPIQWTWVFLVVLWIVAGMVLSYCIVAGFVKWRARKCTDALSRTAAIMATSLSFLGTGAILWMWADFWWSWSRTYPPVGLEPLMGGVLASMPTSLRLLAINLILAGFGLTVAILLSGKTGFKWSRQATSAGDKQD